MHAHRFCMFSVFGSHVSFAAFRIVSNPRNSIRFKLEYFDLLFDQSYSNLLTVRFKPISNNLKRPFNTQRLAHGLSRLESLDTAGFKLFLTQKRLKNKPIWDSTTVWQKLLRCLASFTHQRGLISLTKPRWAQYSPIGTFALGPADGIAISGATSHSILGWTCVKNASNYNVEFLI